MRFTLTAGQRGDCPQARTLIEGLPAEIIMADAAYDADPLRQKITEKAAITVILNNPSRARKYPLDKYLYAPVPPRRILLLKTQAVPKGCNALRENGKHYLTVINIAATILRLA